MEAYQPGQISLAINPSAEPVLIPKKQVERKRRIIADLPKPPKEVESSNEPSKKKTKTLNEKHADDDRNDRTVFIGNVPTSTTAKAIRKLVAGKAEVESVRFRSASFSQLNLPKKAAFIRGMFHEARNTMNCYAVLKDAASVADVLSLNGTCFEDHVIRVDRVGGENTHDDSRCVFVGNLPFDVSEDDLWKFFDTCGPIDYVRCIRDRYTNVGKGFAYVQFADRTSVKQALAFNEGLFKGRNIRVFKSGKQQNPALQRIKRKVNKERHQKRSNVSFEGTHALAPKKKKSSDKKKRKLIAIAPKLKKKKHTQI